LVGKFTLRSRTTGFYYDIFRSLVHILVIMIIEFVCGDFGKHHLMPWLGLKIVMNREEVNWMLGSYHQPRQDVIRSC
jgi:hypothetical protein